MVRRQRLVIARGARVGKQFSNAVLMFVVELRTINDSLFQIIYQTIALAQEPLNIVLRLR